MQVSNLAQSINEEIRRSVNALKQSILNELRAEVIDLIDKRLEEKIKQLKIHGQGQKEDPKNNGDNMIRLNDEDE